MYIDSCTLVFPAHLLYFTLILLHCIASVMRFNDYYSYVLFRLAINIEHRVLILLKTALRDSVPRKFGHRNIGLQDSAPQDIGPREFGSQDFGPRDSLPRDSGPRDSLPRDFGLRDSAPQDFGHRNIVLQDSAPGILGPGIGSAGFWPPGFCPPGF